jgi:hypothetical protein
MTGGLITIGQGSLKPLYVVHKGEIVAVIPGLPPDFYYNRIHYTVVRALPPFSVTYRKPRGGNK